VEVWRLEMRSTSESLLNCIKRQPEKQMGDLCATLDFFASDMPDFENRNHLQPALLTLIN